SSRQRTGPPAGRHRAVCNQSVSRHGANGGRPFGAPAGCVGWHAQAVANDERTGGDGGGSGARIKRAGADGPARGVTSGTSGVSALYPNSRFCYSQKVEFLTT